MKHNFLVLFFCLLGISTTFSARAEVVASGTHGTNVNWALDDEGQLTISGSGAMAQFNAETNYPWYAHRSNIISVIIENGITNISNYAFRNYSNLTSVTFPDGMASIGFSAFYGCFGLTSLTIPGSVSSIGSSAFSFCSGLTSLTIPGSVSSIGSYAFSYCSGLTSITISDGVTSIGEHAFVYCNYLKYVTIPNSVTSIEAAAFSECPRLIEVRVQATLVPTLGERVFRDCEYCSSNNQYVSFIVPAQSLDDYKSAEGWSPFAVRIIPDNAQTEYNITVTAMDDRSALEAEITDPLLINVTKLKVAGTINSYDLMVIRNKMLNLHELDLEDASIVYNSYEYYTGKHSEDNVFPSNVFASPKKITNLKLPSTLKRIGNDAVSGCSYLTSITIPNSVESIGGSAFYCCSDLTSITIPNSVTSIEGSAFSGCSGLTSVSIPNSVTSIRDRVFQSCSSLTSITIPNIVTSIDEYAFSGCSGLTTITIPDGVTSIGNGAFSSTNLSSVYVKMVDPISIAQSTFSSATFQNSTLYIPYNEEWNTTYNKYYYNTQWSQFVNLGTWDPTYSGFFVDNDYDLDGGTIQGEDEVDENGDPVLDEHGHPRKHHPHGDFHAGCGFLVSHTGHQHLRQGHLRYNSTKCGSLIGDGRLWNDQEQHDAEANLIIDVLYCDIDVTANRWYFFSFPFDVDRSNISAPGNHVFREYDGAQRASNNSASGNWKTADNDHLYAGKGYIFQCNQSGTLSIPMNNPDFAHEAPRTLEQHAAANTQNAHWNFIGNPYTSYYELEDINYDAPITIWNGSSYEAIRPGDDDYTFHPFEAYFVQQPNVQTTQVGHDRSKRETFNQSQVHAQHAAERRAMQQVNPNRLIVNLTISDGENSDKTRLVYNDTHTMDYELNCDAAKFISSEAVPQIYTTYSGVNYSINERPKGTYEAQLGIRVPADGTYTIAATRMDVPLLLEDRLTGIIHDLTMGGYVFSAEAGYNSERFSVRINNEETGIADFLAETGVSVFASEGKINLTGIADTTVSVFSVSGQQVAELVSDGLISVPSGTYLVRAGDHTTKVLVK